jgi:hypothetical protein
MAFLSAVLGAAFDQGRWLNRVGVIFGVNRRVKAPVV